MNNFQEIETVGEYIVLASQDLQGQNDTNFEERLIKKVGQYEVLVNPRGRSIRDRNRRQAIWNEIGAALNEPAQKCKQRWRSLRDRFVRERKKVQDPYNKDYYEQVEWELYPSMYASLNGDRLTEREKENEWSDEDPFATRNFEEFLLESTYESTTKNPSTENRVQPAEFCEKLKEEFTQRFGTEQSDDNELFMTLIAKKVKDLPARNKMRLQEKIFQLVNQEVMAFLESS